jgi:stage III sporulation protein AD
MTALLKTCGAALLCVLAILVLRHMGRDIHLPLQWTGIVLLFGVALVTLQPVILWLAEVGQGGDVHETVSLLLRALGIAALSQVCADLCRQSGEAAIASGVELAGKAQLLLLALPTMEELFAVATALLTSA